MTGNELINTPALPPGLREIRILARKAKAYHVLRPYPFVSFQTWKEEDRGPLPQCRPFVRNIVTKGARFLFGKPVHFKIEGDEELTEKVNDAWNGACMGSRAIGMAKDAALQGAVDLKWGVTEQGRVTIDVLDPTEHSRLYFDQLDPTKLLMARTQVAAFDFVQQAWFWHREEWTDDRWVKYDPLLCRTLTDVQGGLNPYAFVEEADKGNFMESSSVPNPFGIVPFARVLNADSGDEWGMGDLWPYYNIVDQINFNRDLEHKDNQKKIDPDIAYIDLSQSNAESPDYSGNPDKLQSLQSDGEHPDIRVIESSHDIREHVRLFADELKRELYNAVGSVDLNAEEVTNKGALTAQVSQFLLAPLIETTNEKRGLYGEDGCSVFMERLCTGMANYGAEGWREAKTVETVWPNMVEFSEAEKTEAVTRQSMMVEKAFTTHERATRELAVMDGVVDVDELVEDTKPLAEEIKKQADELHESTVKPEPMSRPAAG